MNTSQKNGAPSKEPHKKIQIRIEAMAVGGRGLARHDSMVVFVDRVVPGDLVEVEITKQHKNFAEAQLLNILEASPSRIEPQCPHWQECGGCAFQNMNYTEQIKQKTLMFQQSLKKIAGAEVQISDCIPSPKTFRYRSRIQLHIHNRKLGYFQKSTHQLVEIKDCLLAQEKVAHLIAKVQLNKPDQRIELNQSGIQYQLQDEAEDADFGFSQVNPEMNQQMISLVLAQAEKLFSLSKSPIYEILDLYAGSGNLSFPLAKKFSNQKLQAVELSTENVKRAQKSLENDSELSRVKFYQSKVEAFIDRKSRLSNTLVILDPPRAGAGIQLMQNMIKKQVPALIYVSCHPASLSRDLKVLIQAGYKIEKAQALDMFPQTDHMESLVSLYHPDLKPTT